MVTLILFSCDSFQTTREQKVSVTTGPRFALLPSSLSDVPPRWKMSRGKHSPTVWRVKFRRKKNEERWKFNFSHKGYPPLQQTTAQVNNKKPTLTFPLCPWVHTKGNVTGLLKTLQSEWVTVGAQNEYIRSHMGTVIIRCVSWGQSWFYVDLTETKKNSETLILMPVERKLSFLVEFEF